MCVLLITVLTQAKVTGRPEQATDKIQKDQVEQVKCMSYT